MGRTAKPTRVLVAAELERLHRLARHLRDPEDRRRLEKLLEEADRVLEAYRYQPMSDPLEPLLIAMILGLARRVEELERGCGCR